MDSAYAAMRMALRTLLSVGFAALAIGCGEDDEPAANGGRAGAGGAGGNAGASAGGSTGAQGGAAGTGAAGAGGAPCSEPASEIPPGSVCIHEVRGRMVDEAGVPIPSLLATVCGAICFYGESQPTGSFTVQVGAHVPLVEYSVLPHARPERVGFYFQLPSEARGPVIEMGDLPVPLMPTEGPELVVKTDTAGAPAQTVTNGDVTLDVEAGIRFELDVDEVAKRSSARNSERSRLLRPCAARSPVPRSASSRSTRLRPSTRASGASVTTPWWGRECRSRTAPVSAPVRRSRCSRSGATWTTLGCVRPHSSRWRAGE